MYKQIKNYLINWSTSLIKPFFPVLILLLFFTLAGNYLSTFDPLFSMASTLCLYIAVIRVCIAFAAFYDEQSTNTVGSSGSGSLSSAGIGLSDTDDGAHSGTGTGGSRGNHTGALPEKT